MKISKFGGSSVSNSSQFKKVKNIILSDQERQVVVVSAMGKDDSNSSKMTDLLFLLHTHLELNINYDTLFDTIINRFMIVKKELQLSIDIEKELLEFKSELHSKISKDYLVSRGEYFTARLMSEYLGFTFIDAADVLFVNYNGNIDYEKTISKVQFAYDTHKQIVVPGFYAITPDNEIRLFPRGGSDLTGSILAKALQVELYENWTDVDGIYSANPSIIKDALQIEKITYGELRELSYRGANVLHQETIVPLEESTIPIVIKNTNNPDNKGTLITSKIKANGNIMTGLSGKQDFTSFNITKRNNQSKIEVLRDVLDVFIRYNVNIEHIPSGIDTLSVVVESSSIQNNRFEIIRDIRNINGVLSMDVEHGISLIAIVGRNMANIPGIAGKLFSALGDNKINIKVIAQASTELSIIVGVDNDNYENAIRVIYKKFF